MDERIKKRAALYQLIKLVDDNNGCIEINTDVIKKVFNDANDIVRIQYVSGEIALLADAEFKIMDDAIRKWLANHQ